MLKPAGPPRGDALVQLLALVPGALFLCTFVWRSGWDARGTRHFTLFDDAMISMTYARTLSQTGEWVWFPGASRVQGFTNPLWTLYMALLHKLGLENSLASLAVSVSGIGILLGTAFLAARITRLALRDVEGAREASAIAGGALLFLYPLVFWTLRGMEVGLLSLLALSSLATLMRASFRWTQGLPATKALLTCGGLGSLGVLVRLDFLLIAGVAAVLATLWAPDGQSRKRALAFTVLPIVVSVAAVLAFQEAYWGDFLTNTYRLKVSGFGIADRVTRGLVNSGKALPTAALAAASVFATRALPIGGYGRRWIIASSWTAAVAATYSIWVGGDAWEWSLMLNRYVCIALPALLVSTVIAAAQLIANNRGWRPAPLCALAIAGLGYGARSNPIGFEVRPALLECLLLSCVSFGVLWTARSNLRSPKKAVRRLFAVATCFVTATGALPGAFWIRDGGIHCRDDARLSEQALQLRNVTDDDAVVASSWAGAPGYYSRRTMIDLLGKSDRVVAALPPVVDKESNEAAELYPGHNKWSYDYSIGQLRPDVVLRLWSPTRRDLLNLGEWGYERRCLNEEDAGAYFLRTSRKIHWEGLKVCPPSPLALPD